ncbi:MAG: hypothetical protein B7Z37_12345 [Verrucomicrobia bacterium 12-59-8]|nr:MAG: hypothetical protein B7Z37_12345 [Verrucomicrobia bacterium 12-59-8]
MSDDYTPSTPTAAEAGAVFENLSEADASAVLDSLSTGGDAAGAGGDFSEEVVPGLSSLDEALEGADLAQMTDAQVRDFESGDPERVEAALAAQMAPRAEGEESALAPARVSIKALNQADRARTVQALDLIRAGRTPAEAFAEAFGIAVQAQAAEGFAQEDVADLGAAPDYSQAIDAAPQVAELEQHLSLLQHQYKQAKETYDPVATDLMEQMTDVKMDLREARREAAVVSNHWQGQQAESHTRAMDMFSDLITDADSGFVNCCDDEILLAEAKNDPILFHPDWPEKIGRRVIDKFFTGNAAHSPNSARGTSVIPPAPRHSLRLPGSPVGHGFSAGALSPQTAMAEIDKLTPEQQDAFIHSLDKLTSAKVRH